VSETRTVEEGVLGTFHPVKTTEQESIEKKANEIRRRTDKHREENLQQGSPREQKKTIRKRNRFAEKPREAGAGTLPLQSRRESEREDPKVVQANF